MKRMGLLVMVIAVLFMLNTAHATIWYVHPDSTMNCIDDCLDSCSTGDTVLVGPGTYLENIVWPATQSICLISEYGPDTTIIDGGYPTNIDSGSVIAFVHGQDTNTVVQGFTITSGSGTMVPAYGTAGGGIYCYDNSSPTITSNTITLNTAEYAGGIECYLSSSPIITGNTISRNESDSTAGGIECYDNSMARISQNIITENVGYDGGGIRFTYSFPIIVDNIITDNEVTSYGGGIAGNFSSAVITGNIITGNSALYVGGGIECYGYHYAAGFLISHNIITGNAASNGAGIRCWMSTPIIDSCTIANNIGDGINCSTGADPVITHCNIHGHSGTGVSNSDGNITVLAENNWWGHASGPWHPFTNPSGQGNRVSDYVDYVPWDTVPYQWGVEEHTLSKSIDIALQIKPNPFRNQTEIRYSIHDTGYSMKDVILRIYDASGRLVRSFDPVSRIENQVSRISWSGVDDASRKLASGVYFLKVETGHYSATRKLLLIR